MAGSLQDQLLGAGLIKKQQAKNIKTAKKKAVKQSRANNTELVDEAAELAEKVRLEQRNKSQALNEAQKLEASQKAIQAQIRQIIKLNSIELVKDKERDAAVSYNFNDNNKIKTLYVSSQNHDLISQGRIAIAKLNDGNSDNGDLETYHLIPSEAANKINERNSWSVVLLNDSSTQDADNNTDDLYADYQVPDDLMW